MPQRFLKPGIKDSPKWNGCSFPTQSFYIRMLTIVDDFGRCEADPRVLRGSLFALREDVKTKHVIEMCAEAHTADLVFFYEVDGKWYAQITNWTERARSEKSRFPDNPQRPAANGSVPLLPSFLVPRSSPSPPVASSPPPSAQRGDSKGVGDTIADALDVPPPLNTSQPFVNAWQRWMTIRRGLGRKPRDWNALFCEQLAWLATFPPARAVRILEQSMRNGWQGLFEKGTEDGHDKNSSRTNRPGVNRNTGTLNEKHASAYNSEVARRTLDRRDAPPDGVSDAKQSHPAKDAG